MGEIVVFLSLSFRSMVKWTAKKFGSGSSMIWYNIGKASASPLVEVLQKRKGVETQEELIKRLDSYATILGWGYVETTIFDSQEKKAVIRVTNSLLTRGKNEGLECHFLRGYLSGLYDMIFETHTFCEEALCKNMGANHCEFHVRTR